MTEITAAAKLQAWLDGNGELLKADVRAVLWDLAEAQARLEQFGGTETEWTVARHGRHSIEYSVYAMAESRARNKVREELEIGERASIANRLVGQRRHEDPEAQRHADAINAAMKAGAR